MQQEFPPARILDKIRSARLFLDSLIDAILELHAESQAQPPRLDLAVLGYRAEPGSAPEFVPLLPGSTPGRVWVPLAELAAATVPLRTSGPRRWVPAEAAGDEAPTALALGHAYRLVHQWLRGRPDAAPPIIIHCSDGTEDSPAVAMARRSLQSLAAPGGNVRFYNCLFRGCGPEGDDASAETVAMADSLCTAGELIEPPLLFMKGNSDEGIKPYLKVDSRVYRAAARLLRGLAPGSAEELWDTPPPQSAERPAFSTRTLWMAKRGNADEEWEDAAAVSLAHRRAAVSDGASEGIFVRAWAGILAKSFVEEGPDLDRGESVAAWLQACRRAWKSEIRYATLRYTQQVKVDRTGGGATFLGLELDSAAGQNASGDPHAWKAWAVGDACLFFIRANRLLASFPVTGSADFGFAPALVRTLSDGNALVPVAARGTCRDGDVFVLATDAIAQRLLRSYESGDEPDWERFATLDDRGWRAEVDALRSEGAIVNDDCTLLFVRVGEADALTSDQSAAEANDIALQETEAEMPILANAPDEPLTDPDPAYANQPPVARRRQKGDRAVRVLLAALFAFVPYAAPGAHARAQDPPAVAADEATIAAILLPLRKACANDPSLRGVWIRGGTASPSGSKLVLSGFVDQEAQAGRLEKAALGLWEEMPAWKTAFPEGVDARSLRVFPVRSKYLLNLRRDFANSDAPGQPVRGLLSQTRLDDVYYHPENQRLTFEGRSIDQESFLVMKGLKEPDPRRGKPPGQLARAIDQLFRTYLRPQDLAAAELAINTSNIQFDLENPAPALQRLINENPKFDDVLFQEAWYDAAGMLQFGGLVASEEQRAALAAIVGRELNAGYMSPGRKPEAGPGWSLKGLTATPWRAGLLGHLQAQFAKDTEWLFWHTRLDRASFAYSQDGLALKLKFAGVCIHPAADAVRVLLPRRLDQESGKWLKLPRPVKPQVEFAGIKALENPTKRLQALVPERRALDGVRIDNSYFDPKGKFGLVGLWRGGAPQTVELDSLLRSALRGEDDVLLARGISWQQMIVLPTDRLLHDLRAWAAKNLDESFLEVLYFDEAGKLTLRGFCKKAPQARIESAEAELTRRMDALLGTRATSPSAVALVQHAESLTDHLRAQVPRDTSLDGVRIDRGTYDAEGRFLISGLQDHPGQAQQLEPLLRSASESAEWARHLPNGWRLGEFTAYPLRPLLESLARKMPSDPVFDGVIFTRAFYDASEALVFAGTVVGRPSRPGIEERIKRLLGLDARMIVRVALQAQRQELARAEQASAIALSKILAGDFTTSAPLLDVALLHDPEDTTSWYLRAACSLTRGDTALADRDLRRLNAIERNNDGARRARYRKLERFQGGLRMRMDAMIDQMATESL